MRTVLWIGVLLCWTFKPIFAQNNNNNNNNNAGGITIDAEGVIHSIAKRRSTSTALKRKQAEYAKEALPPNLVEATTQRTLSLKALEAEVSKSLLAKEEIPESLQYLGGLYRIDYIIFADEDVLLSGPAEGFAPDQDGRMVCVESGRPPLNLDDLVVVLRSAVVGEGSIGCSIDPTPENMAKLQQYIRGNSSPTSTSGAQQRIGNMGTILDMQVVSINGVPHDSHFALAIVEADYRMKRISLGVEPSGLREIRSHLSLLAPQGNSLQRWWFMPLYDPLETNEERTIYKLCGQRAQLLAQEEISNSQGERSSATTTRQSTERFAQLFTQHFAKLADNAPVFGELQNLYDMSVLAALVKQDFWDQERAWKMETFLMHEDLPVVRYAVPKYVPSASNFKKIRSTVLGLIGGVTMEPGPILRQPKINADLKVAPFEVSRSENGWYWNSDVK